MHTALRHVASGLTGVLALTAALLAVPATATATTAPPPGPVKIEAEKYARQHGTRVVDAPGASGGRMVDRVSHRNWLRYDRVAVQITGRTLLCFVSPAPEDTEVAIVDVRLGSRRATPVTSIALRTNVGRQTKQWAVGGDVPPGVHTIFLTVRQPAGSQPFALDYIMIAHIPPPPSVNC
jgi:hypothetical protein